MRIAKRDFDGQCRREVTKEENRLDAAMGSVQAPYKRVGLQGVT
jgi:hypothetical protein